MIDNICIDTFEDEYIGYNNVTIPQLFNHLCVHYEAITKKDLARNEDLLQESQDPNNPIETLFKCIGKAAVFVAKTGDVMNDRRKTVRAYNLIKVTREFDTASRDQRNKLVVDRT